MAIPRKQTLQATGYDIRAELCYAETGEPRLIELRSERNRVVQLRARCTELFPDRYSVTLPGGYRALVPTGLWSVLPEGVDAQIRPRSGLAWNHGLTILNAPGTVDPDYRNEWHLLLHNTSTEPFELVHGERLAQVVFTPVLELAESLTQGDEPSRDGGFGSTGR